MTPEEFALLERGDRVMFLKQPTASVIVDRDDSTITFDNDAYYPGAVNTVSIEDAALVVFMAPLSAFYPGATLHTTTNEPKLVTITDVTSRGISYDVEGEGGNFFAWKDATHETDAQSRLAQLFKADLRTVQRVQHPVHGKAAPRPTLETLTAGQRFHDGVHSRPKFYTVLFVAEDHVMAEDEFKCEVKKFTREQLAEMFQSLQVSQIKPGVTIYRAPGMSGEPITQTVDSIKEGAVHYTVDSVITRPDQLLNIVCPFEQRKMYFAI